ASNIAALTMAPARDDLVGPPSSAGRRPLWSTTLACNITAFHSRITSTPPADSRQRSSRASSRGLNLLSFPESGPPPAPRGRRRWRDTRRRQEVTVIDTSGTEKGIG